MLFARFAAGIPSSNEAEIRSGAFLIPTQVRCRAPWHIKCCTHIPMRIHQQHVEATYCWSLDNNCFLCSLNNLFHPTKSLRNIMQSMHHEIEMELNSVLEKRAIVHKCNLFSSIDNSCELGEAWTHFKYLLLGKSMWSSKFPRLFKLACEARTFQEKGLWNLKWKSQHESIHCLQVSTYQLQHILA